jgi:hypothetical protein
MKLKYAYILPVAYIVFFLMDKAIGIMILSIIPLQWWLLGLFLQVWLIIHAIINAPTGVILQIFSEIPDGMISIITISLAWYFIFGVFLDFYDTLPWRRNV